MMSERRFLTRRQFAAAIGAAVTSSAGLTGMQGGLEPLPIELPKPMFEGTPENIRGVERLEHYVETAKGKLVDARGVRARYVRLYSNGSSATEQNHYIEVEVFGRPAA